MTNFGYTILYVNDVEKTIEFYERAFKMKRKFIAPGSDYGELSTGKTTLSFAAIGLAKSNLKNGFAESGIKKKAFGMEIGLTTNDVEKVFKAAIAAGAKAEAEPTTKPWGQVVAYVRDINGFLIEICTPIA